MSNRPYYMQPDVPVNPYYLEVVLPRMFKRLGKTKKDKAKKSLHLSFNRPTEPVQVHVKPKVKKENPMLMFLKKVFPRRKDKMHITNPEGNSANA